MARLIVGRALQTIPMLILISAVVFGLLAAAPGDPARQALTTGLSGFQPDEADVAAKRRELGLDRPLWERYARWWRDALRLDFGRSYVSRRPVADLLRERLAASATLAGIALTASVGLGIPLGVLAAVRAGTPVDSLVRLLTLFGASLPGFWLALLGMWLFAAELRWVPALGSFTPRGIVLPAAVLTLRTVGLLTRLTRATMLDALTMACVPVARAKGLRERTVLLRHALRNALIAPLTALGISLGSLLGGAVVAETVFAYPGLGKLAIDAISTRDYPVIQAFVVIMTAVFIAAGLLVDLLYVIVDPRVRVGGRAT